MIRDIMSGKVSADPAVIAALYLADRLDHITHPDNGMLAILKEKGTRLINETPIELPGRKMAFVHPKAANGVLVELYELT